MSTAKNAKKSTPSGPSTIDLIVKAIATRKEAKGSSAAGIKKTLASMGVDVAKKNTFINNALKRGVSTGVLKQVKGTGASGTFKLDTAKALAEQKAKAQKEKAKIRKTAAQEKSKAKKAAAKVKKAAKVQKTKKAKKPVKKAIKKTSKPKKAVKPKKAATKKPTSSTKPAKKAAVTKKPVAKATKKPAKKSSKKTVQKAAASKK